MTFRLPEDIEQAMRQAEKEPLLTASERDRAEVLDRHMIESVLPHRDPFLLIDRVTRLDTERGLIAARYTLSRSQQVFEGHFPARPVFPGVLQVEAIAQAGILLYLMQADEREIQSVSLTHILGARFAQPIPPEGEITVLARVFDEGMFMAVVGQCLHANTICSMAAIQGIL